VIALGIRRLSSNKQNASVPKIAFALQSPVLIAEHRSQRWGERESTGPKDFRIIRVQTKSGWNKLNSIIFHETLCMLFLSSRHSNVKSGAE
jgi:hypothetical protein